MSPPYKYKNADLVIRKMARLHIESFSESHLFSVFLGCLYKCNCHIRCYINVDELMNSAFGLLCNIFFQFLQNLLIDPKIKHTSAIYLFLVIHVNLSFFSLFLNNLHIYCIQLLHRNNYYQYFF